MQATSEWPKRWFKHESLAGLVAYLAWKLPQTFFEVEGAVDHAVTAGIAILMAVRGWRCRVCWHLDVKERSGMAA